MHYGIDGHSACPHHKLARDAEFTDLRKGDGSSLVADSKRLPVLAVSPTKVVEYESLDVLAVRYGIPDQDNLLRKSCAVISLPFDIQCVVDTVPCPTCRITRSSRGELGRKVWPFS